MLQSTSLQVKYILWLTFHKILATLAWTYSIAIINTQVLDTVKCARLTLESYRQTCQWKHTACHGNCHRLVQQYPECSPLSVSAQSRTRPELCSTALERFSVCRIVLNRSIHAAE